MNTRKIAVMTATTVMVGTPRTLYWATGDASYRSFRRQGRMIAATTVARNVTASTAVASKKIPWNLGTYEATALITIDGTIIKTSEPYGTRRFAEMLAAHE